MGRKGFSLPGYLPRGITKLPRKSKKERIADDMRKDRPYGCYFKDNKCQYFNRYYANMGYGGYGERPTYWQPRHLSVDEGETMFFYEGSTSPWTNAKNMKLYNKALERFANYEAVETEAEARG